MQNIIVVWYQIIVMENIMFNDCFVIYYKVMDGILIIQLNDHNNFRNDNITYIYMAQST